MPLSLSKDSLTKCFVVSPTLRHIIIDDLLIASSSKEEHAEHVRAVLQHFNDHGIINPESANSWHWSLFFGHLVGICPLPKKVEALRNFPRPSSQCKVCAVKTQPS